MKRKGRPRCTAACFAAAAGGALLARGLGTEHERGGSVIVPSRGGRGAGGGGGGVRGDAAAAEPCRVAEVHRERAFEHRRGVRGLVERGTVGGRRRWRGREPAEDVAGEVRACDGHGDWVYCRWVQEDESLHACRRSRTQMLHVMERELYMGLGDNPFTRYTNPLTE
ncbi:hypothetical protein Fmac_007666 [Flemingia macrophylla]|uniref:Uncharacterized protein n=1 Tax=Flemingia macrophylla TaxID=520843 RepID=A0ABD1MV91_9FABA